MYARRLCYMMEAMGHIPCDSHPLIYFIPGPFSSKLVVPIGIGGCIQCITPWLWWLT